MDGFTSEHAVLLVSHAQLYSGICTNYSMIIIWFHSFPGTKWRSLHIFQLLSNITHTTIMPLMTQTKRMRRIRTAAIQLVLATCGYVVAFEGYFRASSSIVCTRRMVEATRTWFKIPITDRMDGKWFESKMIITTPKKLLIRRGSSAVSYLIPERL